MKKAIIIITMIMSILLFDKVKASENYGQNWFNYYLNGNSMVMKPNSDSFMYMGSPNSSSNSNNICFNSTCANDSNNINVEGFDTITFGIGFRQLDTSDFTCSIDGQLVQYNNALTYDGVGGNYYSYIMKYTDMDCYGTNGATIGISAEWNQGYLTPCVINNYVKTDNQRDVYLTVSCPVVKNQTYLRKLNIQSILAQSIYISPYIMKSKDSTQQIIDNQNQNYNDFKNQNATYTDEINPNMNGANETIQYSQNEEQLLDSLDMNTSILDDININASASAFIWDIVEGVRGMNPAIITLMTSILGLGIAKMILNR